jgi:hypothetical protein
MRRPRWAVEQRHWLLRMSRLREYVAKFVEEAAINVASTKISCVITESASRNKPRMLEIVLAEQETDAGVYRFAMMDNENVVVRHVPVN